MKRTVLILLLAALVVPCESQTRLANSIGAQSRGAFEPTSSPPPPAIQERIKPAHYVSWYTRLWQAMHFDIMQYFV